jgi:hypothetical protein
VNENDIAGLALIRIALVDTRLSSELAQSVCAVHVCRRFVALVLRASWRPGGWSDALRRQNVCSDGYADEKEPPSRHQLHLATHHGLASKGHFAIFEQRHPSQVSKLSQTRVALLASAFGQLLHHRSTPCKCTHWIVISAQCTSGDSVICLLLLASVQSTELFGPCHRCWPREIRLRRSTRPDFVIKSASSRARCAVRKAQCVSLDPEVQLGVMQQPTNDVLLRAVRAPRQSSAGAMLHCQSIACCCVHVRLSRNVSKYRNTSRSLSLGCVHTRRTMCCSGGCHTPAVDRHDRHLRSTATHRYFAV